MLSNLGMWCRVDDMFDITMVKHIDTVMYGYSTFGGRGVCNSFRLYSYANCINHSNHFTINYSTVNTLCSFLHQQPSFCICRLSLITKYLRN